MHARASINMRMYVCVGTHEIQFLMQKKGMRADVCIHMHEHTYKACINKHLHTKSIKSFNTYAYKHMSIYIYIYISIYTSTHIHFSCVEPL
jgi:hypothetical protein